MCGNDVNADDIRFIKDLAYISGLRGKDSTGVCQGSVNRKRIKYEIEKSSDSVDFYLWFHSSGQGGNRNILNSVAPNFFMGHVRAATVGDITDKNAHPFDTGVLIGAHNGTLVDDKYKVENMTDSEAMFRDAETNGLVPVLRGLDDKSAYAVTVFHKETGELLFANNGRRSLVYAWNNKRRVFYWASEKILLQCAAYRQGLDISEIFKFQENMTYVLKPDEIRFGVAPGFRVRRIHPLPEKPALENLNKEETPRQTVLNFQPSGPVVPIASRLTNTEVNKQAKEVLRIVPRQNVTHKKAHALKQNCCYCQCEMDLYDQYCGTEIDTNVYSCATCDDIQREMSRKIPKEMLN